jgi:2-polyprenyl-6-methoxyphenol hydroxylase-like FAD-dependent oxidoreductase
VLEREPSVYHLPRAVALDGEGMRLFQTMGLAYELLPRSMSAATSATSAPTASYCC